jgi:type III pantothenate kinase
MNVPTIMLLIDAGNTRIKLGLLDSAGTLQLLTCLDTQPASDLAWYAALMPHAQALKSVRRIMGVCVAGDAVKYRLKHALNTFQPLNGKLELIIEWLSGTTVLNGLSNDYATPHTLGADRWLALYGVLHGTSHQKTPYILATLGTATTIDVVYWQGTQAHFAGGIILAGLSSAWQSVSRSTAQLPDVSDIGKVKWHGLKTEIPNNTQTALIQGAVLAQVGAVQAMMAQVTRLYDTPTLYLAGGAAERVSDYLPDALLLKHPVLLGLVAYTKQPSRP